MPIEEPKALSHSKHHLRSDRMTSTPKSPPAATTRSTSDGEPAPRLPHERDESSDSQTSDEPREVMRQAKKDIDSGKQETGRGEVTDAVYERQKQPASPAAKKSPPGGRR